MATNQKIGETGWFYHAPRKQDNTEPQGAPPPSQIPGLGQDQGPYEEPRRPLLKESDSPYIRMAKMGGREDLLRIRDPKPKSEKPVGYPRVDWFYHEDNAEPAPENNGNYEFTLPDYMVHQGYNGNENPNYEAKRLPYAYDKTTAYEREGDDIRDKNFRIEEHQKPGYGVRSQKQAGKPVKHTPIATEKGKAPVSELEEGKYRPKPMKMPPQEDTPNMGKILSNEYQREWETEQNKWSEKQKSVQQKQERGPQRQDKFESEYQSQMSASKQRGSQNNSAARSRAPPQKVPSAKARQEQEDKELFKLSKYKNVPAKVDHQREQPESNAPYYTDNQPSEYYAPPEAYQQSYSSPPPQQTHYAAQPQQYRQVTPQHEAPVDHHTYNTAASDYPWGLHSDEQQLQNQRSKPQPPPPSDEQRYTPSSYQENKRQAVVNARGSGGVPYAVYSDDQLRAGQRKGSGIGPRQVGQNIDSTNLEAMAERRREAKANARRTSDLPYATIGEDDRAHQVPAQNYYDMQPPEGVQLTPYQENKYAAAHNAHRHKDLPYGTDEGINRKSPKIGQRHHVQAMQMDMNDYRQRREEAYGNAHRTQEIPFATDRHSDGLKDSSRIGPRHPGETGYQDPSFYLEMREAAKNNARPKKEAPFAVDGYRPGRRATPKLGPRHPGQDLTIDSSVLKERHAQALANAHRTTEAPFGTDPEYFHGYRNV